MNQAIWILLTAVVAVVFAVAVIGIGDTGLDDSASFLFGLTDTKKCELWASQGKVAKVQNSDCRSKFVQRARNVDTGQAGSDQGSSSGTGSGSDQGPGRSLSELNQETEGNLGSLFGG